MADPFIPFPAEQGYEYGTFAPLAQRPIPYANALQPQLAVPRVVADPINSLVEALQTPGNALAGRLGQSPQELMGPALTTAQGLMAMGATASPLGRFSVAPVEHDPFAVSPEARAVSQALARQHEVEDVRLGVGPGTSQATADATAWQAKIDKMIADGRFEPVEHDPFDATQYVKAGGV